MAIKACLFDVFGTVVDWRSSIARETESLLAPKFGALDWADFADRWRAKYQPSMERVRSGEVGWRKLDDLHRENLLELLAELDLTGLSDDEIDHLNRAWHRLSPWPDSVAGLTRLKSRYIVATLSNGNISLMVDMAKHTGLPWDMVLGSEVARAYKPMPEAYLRSAAALDLAPAECLMVAAHNGDLVAAGALGFATAFVVRPTEHGPDQRIDLEAENDYDHVCRDFLDLADQLGCE